MDEKTYKTYVMQYSDMDMFERQLATCRKWEREGKIHILDVRDAIYPVSPILDAIIPNKK